MAAQKRSTKGKREKNVSYIEVRPMEARDMLKRSTEAPRAGLRNDYRESLKRPLGHAKVPEGITVGPNGYAMNTVGDCLSPVFNEGDVVLCDPDQAALAGDYVAIWWKGGDRQPHIKRLAYALPPNGLWDSDVLEAVIVVEQLNPPKRLAADLSRVAAVHKVLGKAEVAHG